VLVVGRNVALPMATAAKNTDAIGRDRLCAAVAAFDRLGVACVVVDCGSAITIDAVNEEGVYLGGVILPGLAMSAKALAQQTAQLPQVDIAAATPPEFVFGETTEQDILGGIVYGARSAIRERVEAYATYLGSWPLVILTGGDAKLICPNVSDDEIVQAVVDDLTIRGIAMAYYKILTQ
jgi:type III pantothenate kinase